MYEYVYTLHMQSYKCQTIESEFSGMSLGTGGLS